MIITLRREASRADGTIGALEINGKKFPTLENPARPGDKHDTCLPPGMYKLVPKQRASGEKAFAIVNPMEGVWETPTEVPRHAVTDARSAVFIAAGVTVDDLIGSHIAPGKLRLRRGFGWFMEGSREAMNEIRTLIGTRFDLTLIIE